MAVVAGTRSEDVIQVLKQIKEEAREAVEEVTLYLSDSIRRIVTIAFPKAKRVIDCFYIQKLACGCRAGNPCSPSLGRTAAEQ